MKRVALVFGVVSLLVLIDGLYMQFAHYHPGDQNTFFGNQALILSDAQVTLISAGFLFLATVIMWVIAVHRDARSRARQAGRDPASGEEPGQPGSRTASRA
jgi:hypothetical protein